MVLKKYNPVERAPFAGWNVFDLEFNGLPEELLMELGKFTERNGLGIIALRLHDKAPIYYCCPRCLKAHLIKRARKMKLSKKIERQICEMLSCETGHEGYYIDKEKLVKI